MLAALIRDRITEYLADFSAEFRVLASEDDPFDVVGRAPQVPIHAPQHLGRER